MHRTQQTVSSNTRPGRLERLADPAGLAGPAGTAGAAGAAGEGRPRRTADRPRGSVALALSMALIPAGLLGGCGETALETETSAASSEVASAPTSDDRSGMASAAASDAAAVGSASADAPRGAPRAPSATASAPVVATDAGWRLAGTVLADGWQPIRDGVAITAATGEDAGAATGVTVTYDRSTSIASGIAFMLPPGTTANLETLVVRGSAPSPQRLHVCLTDADGFVWTFPTIRVTPASDRFELSGADLRPDPFQNRGRTAPGAPDWEAMQMLTILDITGFMGAPVVSCTWTIDEVVGVTR